MVLPVTISGTEMVRINSYYGPFKSSGGNYYAILLDSTDAGQIEAWKATDPTSSFTEQDAADKPDLLFATINSLWAFQDGDKIHIVTQSLISITDAFVDYHIFNMATDNWDTTEETVQDVADSDDHYACSIMLRSDGDVIVIYQTELETLHGTDRGRLAYARKEGTWTTDIAVDDAGLVDWTDAVIVPGSSDRAHFFFQDATSNDSYQRTLTSGNSLETFPSASDTASSNTDHLFGHGVSYDDGGTQRVRCPYLSGSGISLAEMDSSDTPGTFTENPSVGDNSASPGRYCLSNEGTNEHLLYIRVTENDIYHDENDGVDTEIVDGVTATAISCNVYTRNGATVLAYLWKDSVAGAVKYDEVELIAGVGADEFMAAIGARRQDVDRMPLEVVSY